LPKGNKATLRRFVIPPSCTNNLKIMINLMCKRGRGVYNLIFSNFINGLNNYKIPAKRARLPLYKGIYNIYCFGSKKIRASLELGSAFETSRLPFSVLPISLVNRYFAILILKSIFVCVPIIISILLSYLITS